MRGHAIEFTPKQTALIEEWCRRYPKGKGIDMKRVNAEDGHRLTELMVETGRDNKKIYQKAMYHRENVLGDVAKKPGKLKVSRAEGPYKCPVCGDRFATKQGLGGHTNTHRQSTRTGTTSSNDIIVAFDVTEGTMPVNIPINLFNKLLTDYVIVNTHGTPRLAKLI